MKQFLQIFVLIFISLFSKGQVNKAGFPFNAATGDIHIIDSVKLRPAYAIFWCKELITNWGDYTAFGSMKKTLTWLPKNVGIGFMSIYEDELEKDKYFKDTQIDYWSTLPNGKVDSGDKTNGTVRVRISFKMKESFLMLEFTDFLYFGSHNEIGHFEDVHLIGPDGVHTLSEAEKPWNRIKKEYYTRIQAVCQNLKEYVSEHYKKY